MELLAILFPTLSHPKQSEICLRKAIVALLLNKYASCSKAILNKPSQICQIL